MTVIGDGAWGTALALVLHDNNFRVTIWSHDATYAETVNHTHENSKFLPGVTLPESLTVSSDMAGAVSDSHLLVMAAPTQFVRSVSERLAPCYPKGVPVLSVAKGIERETLLRPSQIIREVVGRSAPLAVLSGPSHAEEVARKMPTSVSVASNNFQLAVLVQDAFTTSYFRPYTTNDVAGVELGGALKNVIGIASGILDGLGAGDNAKSALITRGLAEITRLGVALGARRSTFAGLSGIGDLITTCISPHGRNHRCGYEIGRGKTLQQFLDSTEQAIEGVWTCQSVRQLAARHDVEMPICEQVYQVLFNNKPPASAINDLMTRQTRQEED